MAVWRRHAGWLSRCCRSFTACVMPCCAVGMPSLMTCHATPCAVPTLRPRLLAPPLPAAPLSRWRSCCSRRPAARWPSLCASVTASQPAPCLPPCVSPAAAMRSGS